ncbi:MAG: ATP-binding protein [Vicinamibacterales bacterium]|jgi:signal transduction histidine kinase|nr:ATP-binding protein [Vicinamibacterales bacterium]
MQVSTTAAPATRSRSRADAGVPASFYRDIVASLRNAVIAVQRDGRLAVMNDGAYLALGLTPSPTDIGSPFVDVLRPCPDIVRILEGAFELSHLPNRAELRIRATGKVIGYTLGLVRTPAGEVAGATLLFKDLTRVEQLEERERLRDRLAALGEMAAAIAHEVKNPLAGIEVMAGLLKRRVSDSVEAQSLLGEIIHEAKMANAIVMEVLEFVRPIRLHVEPVAMGRVIDDAIAAAESLVPRGRIRVSTDVPPDLVAVEADAQQLRQLVTNLVTNAFEALDGDGRLTLTARHQPGLDAGQPTPGHVLLDVVDDGPGVPEDVRDRIFSPFFTTKPRGSGLGLSIVRKIVDAHDGRIDVCPSPQGGTRFRVTLPVVPLRDEPATNEAA